MTMTSGDVSGLMYTGFGIGVMALGLGLVANMAKDITTKYAGKKKRKNKKNLKTPPPSDYGGKLFSIENWQS